MVEGWKIRGLCSSLSPSDADRLFFPANNVISKEAQAMCGRCSVNEKCGDAGTQETHGIWNAQYASKLDDECGD